MIIRITIYEHVQNSQAFLSSQYICLHKEIINSFWYWSNELFITWQAIMVFNYFNKAPFTFLAFPRVILVPSANRV